ncbi:wax synthase isoform 2, partial [Genlisea aurea]
DSEFESFIKVWLTAVASLIYCQQIAGRIHGGAVRLIAVLPVVCLFLILPLRLSSVHLSGPTVFYLVWLANFKLLLFAFDAGPLAGDPPLPLIQFVSIGLLPIKPLQKSPSRFDQKSPTGFQFLVKSLALVAIVWLYRYREFLNPFLILILYCGNVYLGVDLILAVTAAPVRALGFEIEPQFDEPYLSTSLQDFWGRRWNLMVTGILRPSVYFPVRRLTSPYVGKKWGQRAAVLATFAVSGLMHELIYYYLTARARPTWEVTWFFLLHGVCLAVEGAVKTAVGDGGLRIPTAASRLLTVGFAVVTCGWLFFPQLTRNGVDARAIEEYYRIAAWIK